MDDDASTSSTIEDYKELCTQLTGKVIEQRAKIIKLKRENKRLKKEIQVINHGLEQVRGISWQDQNLTS